MTLFQNVDVGALLYIALKNSSVLVSIERRSYTPDSDVLSVGSVSSTFYPCRAITSVSTETDSKTSLSTSVLNSSVLTDSVDILPAIGDIVNINSGRYVGRRFGITKVESTDFGGIYKVKGSEL